MDKLDLLLSGEIEIEGLIPDSSNGALKVLVSNSKQNMQAIIKPEVSIRPLWDFPDLDLNNREYATYLLDRALDTKLCSRNRDEKRSRNWQFSHSGMG